MKELQDRILQISYEQKLSHIGSCLTALPIIDAVYKVKNPEDVFILSSGHAHLAHAVVKESRGLGNIEDLMKAGIHCDRENGCDVSTGSLGQGLPIAVGMAMANKERRVFCLVSDGEMAEGSIWEALRIAWEQKLSNLLVLINVNGWGAYRKIDGSTIWESLRGFGWGLELLEEDSEELVEAIFEFRKLPTALFIRTDVEKYSFLKGQSAHYKVLSEEEYGTTK